ncbi:predicted protein [Scheffersomyces stipitis CBS 6054]|uniref:Phosphatidylinositol transfer protein SFH5 n=1 Tax=Scheffersomyces stipitis (strain ATCC 58785 / CBS 6054 / NBRC 10063 / NRRL Y-11545) TaxID=322104 RepID=SFH5_PICST|nr:predicted protein [Scheffersomyces stipitis CBS 6054]A3LPR9.2 RecName: Full=Phosphatidylinositol transfer protein SFH5; Short=PITP SFH5 [Scheffersomyces stipitis CBS 6054]ABN65091.2 predicted protein [Scheffersomyces stipitis CBS 6054]KAG2735911.1 hypothetical protein G9P44_000001 [Scheffersomyces stipitis]
MSEPEKTDSVETVKNTIKSTQLTTEHAKKLTQVVNSIPTILSKLDNSEYDEIFGHRINVDSKKFVDVAVRNEILLKFLAADEYDVELATKRLIDTLNWRNKFHPLSAAFDENFNKALNDLGAITNFVGLKSDNLNVVTWNFYGATTPKKLFEEYGDNAGTTTNQRPGSQFLRWRIGLMEKSLQLVDFTDPKNNKIAQVHDYNNVSMFKVDKGMRAATKEIIKIFGDNYPELLSTKFFINVPSLMSWVFTFFKTIGVISEATLKKFQVLNSGNLTEWFGKSNLPPTYGGDSKSSMKELNVASIKLSPYGEYILEELGKKEIEDVIDEVE